MKYAALDLSKIHSLPFPLEQYYQEETKKVQVCLHHTASGRGIDGDYQSWLATPEHVGTPIIVGMDGVINKLFDEKFWIHHLGIKADVFTHLKIPIINTPLNKLCIGIEIDSWGPLALHDGKYYSYVGTVVPSEEVHSYATPFKTMPNSPFFDKIAVSGKPAIFYHKYFDAQILAVAQLLESYHERFGIDLTYHEDMWSLNTKALTGAPGVWTHVSYNPEKVDCHPQPELIAMLQNLTA